MSNLRPLAIQAFAHSRIFALGLVLGCLGSVWVVGGYPVGFLDGLRSCRPTQAEARR